MTDNPLYQVVACFATATVFTWEKLLCKYATLLCGRPLAIEENPSVLAVAEALSLWNAWIANELFQTLKNCKIKDSRRGRNHSIDEAARPETANKLRS
jgi:hypothetical protein